MYSLMKCIEKKIPLKYNFQIIINITIDSGCHMYVMHVYDRTFISVDEFRSLFMVFFIQGLVQIKIQKLFWRMQEGK